MVLTFQGSDDISARDYDCCPVSSTLLCTTGTMTLLIRGIYILLPVRQSVSVAFNNCQLDNLIFNKLPIEIKNTSNNLKKFKVALRHFLNTHSIYTVDEYLIG